MDRKIKIIEKSWKQTFYLKIIADIKPKITHDGSDNKYKNIFNEMVKQVNHLMNEIDRSSNLNDKMVAQQ